MTLLAFQQLLTTGGEAAIHEYIKQHPKILVGQTHIEPNIVMRELQLSSGLRPDFVYIENVSVKQCLHIVEIEDPTKPIFNKRSATFSKEFRHAYQQIEDYVLCANRNRGWVYDLQQSMRDHYRTTVEISSIMGHLIYGRRSEFADHPERRNRWRAKGSGAIYKIQTYDRLLMEHHDFFAPIYQRAQPQCVVRSHDGFRVST